MQLRERLAHIARPVATARPARRDGVLPAGMSRGSNLQGDVYYRDEYFPLDHRHGRIKLESALDLHPDLLDRLGDGVTQAHLRDAAYLDIETTGLSGGTGTYAFLVGVGTFEGFAFRVRQFFLADPSGEAAMLLAINETVERCQAIVTFNGRTFDLPQLATRYALARLRPLGEGLTHIDLLHPARRLYGKTLDSCRLGEIERCLLGLKRYGDVDGALIPALYFSYIRRANVRGLHPVFEHNSLDVISLAAFLAHLSGVAGQTVELTPAQHLGLGRWDEARGRLDSAAEQYRHAWAGDDDSDEAGEALWRLARLLRRDGRWQEGMDLWQQECEATTSVTRRVRALVELAKLHEHRIRRPGEALGHAEQALELIAGELDSVLFVKSREQLERRVKRLRQKQPV